MDLNLPSTNNTPTLNYKPKPKILYTVYKVFAQTPSSGFQRASFYEGRI